MSRLSVSSLQVFAIDARSNAPRPRLKVHGVWVFGLTLQVYILDEPTKHDSACVVECVALSLERASLSASHSHAFENVLPSCGLSFFIRSRDCVRNVAMNFPIH